MKTQLLFLLLCFKILSTFGQSGVNALPASELTGLTEDSIKAYLSSTKTAPIEGIYKSYQRDGMPHYKLGIIKLGTVFKAVIIETEVPGWSIGEVKASFEPSSIKGVYATKWYLSDKTPFETFSNIEVNSEAVLAIELKDQKTLQKREDYLIKIYPSVNNDAVFKKDNSISSGSGFFLTTDGVIATNAHVIMEASNIEVTLANERGTFTYKAKPLHVDTANDIALLQIKDSTFKNLRSLPYGIAKKTDIGSKVFTIGYPLNDIMGSNYKVTDGIISATSGIADNVKYYQISVPLQPGNSGGPLFDKNGNVVGITTAKLRAVGTKTENVNYALKSSYLLDVYSKLPKSAKISSTSKLANKELQDQVKVLKNYVCLIKTFL